MQVIHNPSSALAQGAFSPSAQDRDDAAKLVRVALNSLSKGVEVAIKSASDAYRFAPNSFTAYTLRDAVGLRSLLALVAGRVSTIADDGQ
jgi:hypothetical protein